MMRTITLLSILLLTIAGFTVVEAKTDKSVYDQFYDLWVKSFYADYINVEDGNINNLASENVIISDNLRVDGSLHINALCENAPLRLVNGVVVADCGGS